MARIYRTSDRIPVRIDDIEVKLSPLSRHQKAEVTKLISGFSRGDITSTQEGVVLAIRMSLKEIKGVEYSDGTPYKLEFDEEGLITEECIEELLNLEMSQKLTMVCSNLMTGIPSQFTYESGEPIEGVERIDTGEESSESKKT